MAAKNNTCVICLEPLLTATEDGHENIKDNDRMCDFGACSPCGHPVHESCFRQWATFQTSDNSDRKKAKNPGIPCPTCHKETTSFVKIFLRVEDKESVSSSDDEEEDEECEERTCGSSAKLNGQASADGTLTRPQSSSDRTRPTSSPCAAAKKNCKRIIHRKQQNNATKLYKKAQWYKKRWMGKCEEVKTLKLEAQNRQKCHHDDLVGLERSQRTNFRLSKELERTIEAARFCRNVVGIACFTAGWIISRTFVGADGGGVDEIL